MEYKYRQIYGRGRKFVIHPKTVLKRSFLTKYLTIKNGISKRAALLIELAKYHFPAKIAEIEKVHDEKYQKKWKVIKEQIDKIQSEKEEQQEMQEVA